MKRLKYGDDFNTLVFVYGSLKRGMAHHQLIEEAVWIGEGSIAALALYDLGPFPMAVADSSASLPIQGELYQVSAELLQQLDRFEGSPRLYERQRQVLMDGRIAWVYVGQARQVRHATLISSGCWQGPQLRFRRRNQPPTSAPQPPALRPDKTH